MGFTILILWYMFCIMFLVRIFWTFNRREKYRKILFNYAIEKDISHKRFADMIISTDCVESYTSTLFKFWIWNYERFIKDKECKRVWKERS